MNGGQDIIGVPVLFNFWSCVVSFLNLISGLLPRAWRFFYEGGGAYAIR